MFQRHSAIVSLHHRHHVRRPFALILQPSQLERGEEADGIRGKCVRKLFLDQLEGR